MPLTRQRTLMHLGDASIDVISEGVGPLVVLLPSSLRDSLDFDPLAERIAAGGYQVLRPQPRGIGLSSPPPTDMTLITLAGDVAAVIQAFSAGPAFVVGHAYGHWVARVTDYLFPELVAGVVVLAAAAKVFPPGVAEQLAVASDTARHRAERLAALRACMFAPANDESAWLSGWYPQWRTAYQQASKWPPQDEWYDSSNAKVLDVQGEQDVWRPAATRRSLLDRLGDKAQVVLIPQAGHAMVPEQPELVAQACLAWFSQFLMSNSKRIP